MLEIKGTVVQLLPIQSGQGSGDRSWRKQDFVLDIPSNYKRQVCISLWGDNIESYKLAVGEEVTASIDIESREYNGKWYTNVKAWKIVKSSSDTPEVGAPNETPWDAYATPPADGGGNSDFDDLPF